jgi:hypothetical protein
VSVTYETAHFNSYRGIINIPSTVLNVNDGETYSVTAIGEEAFRECNDLESVIIPDGVETIEAKVFFNCTHLVSVTIPESVATIGKFAFCSCASLKSIRLPSSVRTIGDDAFNTSGLTSIHIPDGVETIGERAFFQSPSLLSVTIPNRVNTIGNRAFADCCNLTGVTVNWTETLPDMDVHVFGIITLSGVTLHIPPGSKDLYTGASPWKDFFIVADGQTRHGCLHPPKRQGVDM